MSFELPTTRRARRSLPSWSGMAFLVEAMLLLVFLIGSMAVFTQLFGYAVERSGSSRALTEAVAAAENAAERFAADPASAPAQVQDGDMRVVCNVSDENAAGGTLYRATISVYRDGQDEPVYAIRTARYSSEGEVG